MAEDPFFCEECDEDLTHDDIETVEAVPELDVENYEMSTRIAEVYRCSGCGLILGFSPAR